MHGNGFLKLAALGLTVSVLLATPAIAQQRLTMGATHSASGFYTYQVGISNYLATAIDGISINVRELGGAEVSTEALLRDEVDMGIAVTSSDYAAMRGEAPFRAPAEELRTLFYFAPLPLNFVVASESDVQSIADLAGRSFNPGGRGTSTETQVDAIMESLGIEPALVRAEGSDALEAFQNRHIEGFVKAGLHPDGYIQQASASRAVRFIALSEDEIARVTEAHPFFSGATVATGDFYGDAGGDVPSVQTAIGINTTTALDEEIAYRIAAAIFSDEGRKAAADIYPPSAQVDALQLTLNAAVAPLHPGVARYLKEAGHEIPEHLLTQD